MQGCGCEVAPGSEMNYCQSCRSQIQHPSQVSAAGTRTAHSTGSPSVDPHLENTPTAAPHHQHITILQQQPWRITFAQQQQSRHALVLQPQPSWQALMHSLQTLWQLQQFASQLPCWDPVMLNPCPLWLPKQQAAPCLTILCQWTEHAFSPRTGLCWCLTLQHHRASCRPYELSLEGGPMAKPLPAPTNSTSLAVTSTALWVQA